MNMYMGMGNYVRIKHASSAAERWKSSLAALLALTLGFGVAGIAPATAAPISETPPVEKTAESQGAEDVAVGQKEHPATEEDKPSESKASATQEPSQGARTMRVASSGMSLAKNLRGPSVLKPGETVTYELILGCTSITAPCINAVLVDQLPDPLVFEDVTYFGFEAKVDAKISEDKSKVELTFNEKTQDGSGLGLRDGADYSITLTAKLPTEVSPEWDGTALKNSATLSSDAGNATDEADPVSLDIDAAPNATITKKWAQGSLLEQSGAENNLTLGGIKNTSKVGATSLTIAEPSGDSDPFASVAFTGFGNIVYPQGANKLDVAYFVGTEKFTATPGSPNAPPEFPAGLNLSTITGFEFAFSSSNSTETKGGITSNGVAGSIILNTVLREDALPGVVKNEVSITAQTPKGESAPFKASDSFVIDATNYSVAATKSFSPNSVVAEGENHVGIANNRSMVTVGATNTSNQPLKTLSIMEPATGSAPFGAGIDFEKFVSGTWPSGATEGEIIIDEASYKLTHNNGSVVFPENLPVGKTITSFEVKFTGSFAPGAGFEQRFDVLGASPGEHKNEIKVSGDPLAGGKAVTTNKSATLTVIPATETLLGKKAFSPNRVEGIPGDKTTAVLQTRVDQPKTNVDVRKIVQTDIFDQMLPSWKPTTVKVDNKQSADSVKVEYQDANKAWNTLAANAAEKAELTLPPPGCWGADYLHTHVGHLPA